MSIVQLTDGSGQWFNPETSQEWSDRSEHGGWVLYRTKSGRWILRIWSCWADSADSYEEISAEDAAKRWLATEPDRAEVPEGLEEHVAELEI